MILQFVDTASVTARQDEMIMGIPFLARRKKEFKEKGHNTTQDIEVLYRKVERIYLTRFLICI